METAAPIARRHSVAAVEMPVEITHKPRPEYTADARRLRIEGDVSLRVLFLASGGVEVLDVINGLGSGLDESAIRAARQIQFNPARRDGVPVDSAATIRIAFQLAY
jgi:TonB family protein